MSTILLMGPPGTGKSKMACQTAIRRPVHVLDIDRKLKNMAWVKNLTDVSWWELAEPLIRDKLASRVRLLSTNQNPDLEPKGWKTFCEYTDKIEQTKEFKDCGTLVIDSATTLGDHLARAILFLDANGTSTLSPRNWASYQAAWKEVVTVLRDECIRNEKDLIITVHERVSEIPGDSTSKVMKHKDPKSGIVEREFIGTMDIKIATSINGQFGIEMPLHFEEVYGLYVEMEKGNPVWKCRVQPDGRRDLRTSHNVSKAVFNPDFREIWGVTK
mgnify:CR=1 FL=1